MSFSALICFLVVAVLTSARKEPASGLSFGDTCGSLDLAGVGIRKKGPIKVYAVALFADKAACKNECSDAHRPLHGWENRRRSLWTSGARLVLKNINFMYATYCVPI